MAKFILALLLLPLLSSCQNSDYKYTDKETEQFLTEIANHATAEITFVTENEQKPTNDFLLATRYSLSKEKRDEYKAQGHIKNDFDDISDFATYTFKAYDLVNEKNKKLEFVDSGRAIYLQKSSLGEYNGMLFQNVGIDIKLNEKFEKLKGFILVEFEMPNGMKKEKKVMVDISIHDKLTP